MSSTTPAKSKLIFAPGDNPDSSELQPGPRQAAQFRSSGLSFTDLHPDPFIQFHRWFSDPRLRGHVPETCCLSTAELPSGRVSARMVYLKELDQRGFVVYSNWGSSRKASDLLTNPFAALTFWHKPTERQIRIEGITERLSEAESQVYFNTRARGSRIGAWASQQSSVLWSNEQNGNNDKQGDGREVLERQVMKMTERFNPDEETEGAGGDKHDPEIPVPPFWGGLRIVPDMIEFWQGRESRLHDRFRYSLRKVDSADGMEDAGADEGSKSRQQDEGEEKIGKWMIERLSP